MHFKKLYVFCSNSFGIVLKTALFIMHKYFHYSMSHLDLNPVHSSTIFFLL